jgi:hypothetical protein
VQLVPQGQPSVQLVPQGQPSVQLVPQGQPSVQLVPQGQPSVPQRTKACARMVGVGESQAPRSVAQLIGTVGDSTVPPHRSAVPAGEVVAEFCALERESSGV